MGGGGGVEDGGEGGGGGKSVRQEGVSAVRMGVGRRRRGKRGRGGKGGGLEVGGGREGAWLYWEVGRVGGTAGRATMGAKKGPGIKVGIN